ncbi:hypothetical protein ICJ85_16070 [Aestuariibaculum marinum]|uniref:Uncharacterized protein n=1 Tax=Aestuariibaculum marinum TaxID=2683592 RepID=A0A8J6Q0R1_9FLAO|nr:hypothetical protein [Aestuariibaculum marinum]
MSEQSYLYIKPMTPEKPKYIININDNNFETLNEKRTTLSFNYPISKNTEQNTEPQGFDFVSSEKVNKLEEIQINTKKEKVFRDKYLGVLDSLANIDFNADFVCNEHTGIQVLNCFEHGRTNKSTKPVQGKEYEVLLGKNKEELDETYNQNRFYGSIQKVYEYPQLSEEEILKKFNLIMLKGYYGKREFYNPVYDEVTVNDPFPDYRNTLFWKPDIITNTNGEVVIEFHCSDINSNFLGVVEGVSGNSLLGNRRFEFNVKK